MTVNPNKVAFFVRVTHGVRPVACEGAWHVEIAREKGLERQRAVRCGGFGWVGQSNQMGGAHDPNLV